MKKIIIINGPNLNLLGLRPTNIYGNKPFEAFFQELKAEFTQFNLQYFQSNHEGDLIDKLHEIGYEFEGIVLNAGAYTHTSIALADAIEAITSPVIEVHISNIYAREPFRHHSFISAKAQGIIAGLGLEGYRLALQYFV